MCVWGGAAIEIGRGGEEGGLSQMEGGVTGEGMGDGQVGRWSGMVGVVGRGGRGRRSEGEGRAVRGGTGMGKGSGWVSRTGGGQGHGVRGWGQKACHRSNGGHGGSRRAEELCDHGARNHGSVGNGIGRDRLSGQLLRKRWPSTSGRGDLLDGDAKCCEVYGEWCRKGPCCQANFSANGGVPQVEEETSWMEAMPNAVRCMGNGIGGDRAARQTSPQTVVFHKWKRRPPGWRRCQML